MARAKSVVLSPAEKKANITVLKSQIKAAKDSVKNIAGIRKEADKVYNTATKAHLVALKDNDKEAAAANKDLTALVAQLTSLAAPVAA